MKQGVFKVTLFYRRSNQVFEERKVDGVWYFVAVPGEEFDIRITLDKSIALHYPSDQEFGLYVSIDGQNVNYFKNFNKNEIDKEFWFRFFKMDHKNYSFKFTEPIYTCTSQDVENVNKDIGTIELKIMTMNKMLNETRHRNLSNDSNSSTEVKIPIISTYDKKPWKYSSACTTPGDEIRKFNLKGIPSTYYFKSGHQVVSQKFLYHTSLVLTQMDDNIPVKKQLQESITSSSTEGVEELPQHKRSPSSVIDLSCDDTDGVSLKAVHPLVHDSSDDDNDISVQPKKARMI